MFHFIMSVYVISCGKCLTHFILLQYIGFSYIMLCNFCKIVLYYFYINYMKFLQIGIYCYFVVFVSILLLYVYTQK